MVDVMVVLAAGVLTGLLLRKRGRFLLFAGKAAVIVVFALLFLLGLSVGANKTVLGNLRQVGVNAALITAAGIAGSVLLAAGLSRFLLRRGGREK